MSFEFQWPSSFPALFYESTKKALSQALNSGPKLPLLTGGIEVESLGMGSIPPELDLLEIEEIGIDGVFRGRFMLSYAGDAFLTLVAGVSVNPLTAYKHALELFPASTQAILQAAQMEIRLTLSALRLRCLVVLGFDKVTGLTLAFKDDPLESLNVSSSFDSIGVIQGFIQQQIEHQLKERFRRDLPALIHRLSQRWLADMGQHHAASAPIHVERQGANASQDTGSEAEREPDDSFRDPAEVARTLREEAEAAAAHSRTPSTALTTASDLSEGYVDIGQASRASTEVDNSDTESDATGESSTGDVDADEDLSYLEPSSMVWPSLGDASRLRHQPSMDSVITTSSPPKRSQRSLDKRPERRREHITEPSLFIGHGQQSRRDSASNVSVRTRTISAESVQRSESPILRSLALHHTHAAFATTSSSTLNQYATHSQQPSQRHSPAESTDSLIQAAQRKVQRKRLHRIDGSLSAGTTPNASPQKHTKHYVHREQRPSLHHRSSSSGLVRHHPHSSHNTDDRLRIRRKELDEYFPVNHDRPSRHRKRSSEHIRQTVPLQPMQVPQSSRFQFGPTDQPRPTASHRQSNNANIDSLRRNLMNTRLRDSAYFTPSFPG